MQYKVHIVQFASKLNDLKANISKLDQMLGEIPDSDLIILPELANSGYNFQSREEAFASSEDPIKSDFVDFLVGNAKRSGAHIVSGFCEREQDILFNSALLLSEKGVVGKYRKIHLFMNEKDFFKPGNLEPETYQVKDFHLGMLICFDYLFPELWRSLALKGADLIAHPSNLVTPFGARVAPVQGIINRVYVATANRTGTECGLKFNGGSFISDPEGKTLVKAGEKNEEIITAFINTDIPRDKMITPRNHVLNDRRPEFYSSIL